MHTISLRLSTVYAQEATLTISDRDVGASEEFLRVCECGTADVPLVVDPVLLVGGALARP